MDILEQKIAYIWLIRWSEEVRKADNANDYYLAGFNVQVTAKCRAVWM